MAANRRFVIAAGGVRQGDRAEPERMARLFGSLGYEIVDGFRADMSARELETAVRAFATAAERTEDDVLVVYHSGDVDAGDLAGWLFAGTRIGDVLLVLGDADPVDTDALRALCGTATVVVVTAPGRRDLAAAFEQAVTELARTDRPHVAVADVVHRIGGHLQVIGGTRPGPFLPTHDHHRSTRGALRELLKATRPDAGPLGRAERATLSRVVARLGDPGERAIAELYRQSVERATGQPAPEPLGDLHTYPDLVRELAEYLPGAAHPLVQCCALLTKRFPTVPGMTALTSLVREHVDDTSEPVAAPERAFDHVLHFRCHASAEAFHLVRHLAVVPLSIPVMRSVHHATSAAPDPAHLAEIYLGDLLCPVPSTDPDTVSFDFVTGVRAVLLGLLRRTEATRALTAVSHLADTHPEPFARVAADVLRHLRATPDPLDHVALAAANRPPSGDAWDVTIRRTADRLYRYLHRLLDTPEDAEDAVQEVYARARERGGPPENDAVLFGLADTVAAQRRTR